MRQSLTLAPFFILALVPAVKAQQAVTTPGGAVNSVPKYTGSATIGPSALTEVNGNVGVGVLNPYGLLTIGSYSPDGNGSAAKGLLFVETDGNGAFLWTHAAIYDAGSGGYNGSLVFGTDDDGQRDAYITEKMRLDPYGRLGIGTNQPQNLLSIAGGINVDQDDENTGTIFPSPYSTFGITFGNTSGEGIGSPRSGGPNVDGLDFFTGYQRRMSIGQSGNVGINTANPTANLEVNGGIKITSGSNGGIQFADGSVQTKAASSSPSSLTIQSSQTGLVVSAANLDPQNGPYDMTSLANSGKMLFGWNELSGRGEQDLIVNSGPGAPGGFVSGTIATPGRSLLCCQSTQLEKWESAQLRPVKS